MMVLTSPYESPNIHEALCESALLKEEYRLTGIKAEKLQTLITAAKVADIEPIWTTLFAKVRTTQLERI